MAVPPPRRVYTDLEPNLTFDKANGVYLWRNPVTKTRTDFGTNKAEANERARKLNLYLRLKKEQERHGRDPASVPGIIDGYLARQAAA